MNIAGKWQAEKIDDLEACMKTTGVPDVFAKCSPGMKPQLEIVKVGETYTFKDSINVPLSEHTVKLGKSFETVNWLQKPITGVVDMEGNKIVEKSKEGDVQSVITFQTDGSKLIRKRDCADFTCSLTYTKL